MPVTDTSARLALPLLQAAQAQKHITHNEALARLDLLVQLTVQEFDAATPPVTPQEGQVWATGASPGGEWTDQPNMLAAWVNAGWLFIAPQAGWQASDPATGALWVRTGGQWVLATPQTLDNLDGIGIATSSDAFNRLAVASEATLLTHAGAGHQLKINKAAATDTASLLFQTGFGGRAEMGTAGSDDFEIKVSPDGAAFFTGAAFESATGQVSFPNGALVSGAQAYHRANLLGTVAQSGGAPTGAAIERGSNANGEYVRFADGTQICWHSATSGSVTQFGAGTFGNPYSSSGMAWNYPAGFVTAPVVHVQVDTGSLTGSARRLVAIIGVVTPLSTSDITVSRFSGDSTPSTPTLHQCAVGRWF